MKVSPISALPSSSRPKLAHRVNYIPDFACIEKKLVIELDGSQHLEQEEYDEERTKYLESLGYKVIRFWNNDVMKDIDSVVLAILHAIDENSAAE